MKKVIVTTLLLVPLLLNLSYAQEKPIRIGVKVGLPNIIGLNAEYVTPTRVALTADFSYLSLAFREVKATYSYLEAGGNFYFKPTGRGFYGHLSYGRMGFGGSYQSDDSSGRGEGEVHLDLLNFKIGGKLGKGFYFRPEIGFGFLLGGADFRVTYPDGTTERREVPSILAGGPLINLGFGVAF